MEKDVDFAWNHIISQTVINTKEFDAPVFDAGEVYQTVTMYQFVTKED